MSNDNDAIRQANKKALPKFLAIMAVCMVGGVILGIATVSLVSLGDLSGLGDMFAAAGLFLTNKVAVWLLIAVPVLELALCLPIDRNARKRIEQWDGEDERVSDEIENRLSVCIWIGSLATVVEFFLLSVLISGFVSRAGTQEMMPPLVFFGGLAAFLAELIVCVAIQQRMVDAAKKLAPEKQGSVYDVKFAQKWLASCDEAERAMIGQCAFKAYQAMTWACMALWLVFALGGMIFDLGFLPSLAVCVVWGTGQVAYAYWCWKLGQSGGKG